MKYSFAILISIILSTASVAQNYEQTQPLSFLADLEETKMFQKQTISYEVGRYEKEGRFQIFIPKSFSPNQDGINDFFEIQTRSVLDFHIMVFDQWGNFVFDSNDPNLKWDGKIKGKSIRKAPYIYVVKIKTIDGQTLKYSGCLMIEL